jgi:hypothetical protein
MNKQIAGSNMESKSLEEVVLESWNNGSPSPVFNNAAQVRTASISSGDSTQCCGSSSSSRVVYGCMCAHIATPASISSWATAFAPP